MWGRLWGTTLPKILKKLSALEVNRLTSPGRYPVGGVSGLYLQVRSPVARSWIVRVTVHGHRRDIGLGSFGALSLAEARKSALDIHAQIAQGNDPIEDRKLNHAEQKARAARLITFDDCAKQYMDSQMPAWRNDKHKKQWQRTLEMYASPVIGSLPVSHIDMQWVLQVLRPIWTNKNETASRLRGRIEKVLAWATAHGYRNGDNPARWRGNLDVVLPAPSKVQSNRHHPALAFHRCPEFLDHLQSKDSLTARALAFAIFTATRSGEVRGARWSEIDLSERVWTIQADRMKAGKEHRIPLSKPVMELLNSLPTVDDGLLFPAPRKGQLSDMALTGVIRDLHRNSISGGQLGYLDPHQDNRIITVHGFRSAFRDWAGEASTHAREVIEHALAHQLADKAEASYARGTLFTKRRQLMDDWANFLTRQL